MSKDVKPRGRISAYAFFVKTISEEHKHRHPQERIHFSDFTKKCSERWKIMTPKEKVRFEKMEDDDGLRYENEMSSLEPKIQEAGKRKRKRKARDPNAPKQALSAFMFFSSAMRPAIREKHPEWSVADVAKELGKMWALVPQETRQEFETRSTADKDRYAQEKIVFARDGKVPIREDVHNLQSVAHMHNLPTVEGGSPTPRAAPQPPPNPPAQPPMEYRPVEQPA